MQSLFLLATVAFCAVLDVVEPGTGNSTVFLFVLVSLMAFFKSIFIYLVVLHGRIVTAGVLNVDQTLP